MYISYTFSKNCGFLYIFLMMSKHEIFNFSNLCDNKTSELYKNNFIVLSQYIYTTKITTRLGEMQVLALPILLRMPKEGVHHQCPEHLPLNSFLTSSNIHDEYKLIIALSTCYIRQYYVACAYINCLIFMESRVGYVYFVARGR